MVNQQLLDFIKEQTLEGVDKETITKALLAMPLLGGRYTQQDVDEGFGIVSEQIKDIPIVKRVLQAQTPVIETKHFTSYILPVLIMLVFLKFLFSSIGYQDGQINTVPFIISLCIFLISTISVFSRNKLIYKTLNYFLIIIIVFIFVALIYMFHTAVSGPHQASW